MAAATAQPDGPMSFEAANQWLAARVNMPTDMTSAQLAVSPDLHARVKVHSFFSAQVAAADDLEAIREPVDRYTRGEVDLVTARWQIKTALVRRGYAADDVAMTDTPPAGMTDEIWKARKRITNLASTRRLNLVLRQNARMGWAVGREEVSRHPVIEKRWPNWRYISRPDARPSHKALDKLVLPKSDPFWATHTGPWDFGCRCTKEDTDEPVTGGAVTRENPDGSQTATVTNPATGRTLEVLAPESGFVFRIDEPFEAMELSRIHSQPMRGAVMQRLRQLARSLQARFNCTLANALEGPALVHARQGRAAALVDDAAAAVRAGEDVPAAEETIGSLSPELVGELGLDADVVKLGGGRVGHDASPYGFQHQVSGSGMSNHRQQLLSGEMLQSMNETLFAESGTRASVGFNGGNMYLNLANPDTTAMTTLRRVGDQWQVASAARRGEAYNRQQTGVMRKRHGRE